MDDSSFMHGVSEVSNNTPVSYNPMQQEENVLSRRISRTMKAAEPIVYEFTKDKGYLHQYYILREQMYERVLGLQHFSGAEDEIDRRSHIFIARKGNQVIGGARLTIKSPRRNLPLPMEGGDFKLSEALSWLNFDVDSISECSRLALLPGYFKEKVAERILNNLMRKSAASGCFYSVNIASAVQARNYRSIFRNFGVDYKIMTDVEIPSRDLYEGIKMYLSFIDGKALVARDPSLQSLMSADQEEAI